MSTICFTGHRPKKLCGYNKSAYINSVKELENIVTYYYNNGCNKFISGGAQGFDQLAFWAVNNAKKHNCNNIENVVYIPFKGYGENWVEKGLFGKNEFNMMTQIADNTVTLKDAITSKYDIIKALTNRNHAMVDNSDMVIALYENNNWDTDKGGTAECIRYALSHGKNVFILYYTTENNELKITKTDLWGRASISNNYL